ncbi:hypothetical protein ACFQGT_00215 [Natrialbaceae archaeon GCM10025810]
MSGGSLDYVYREVEQAARDGTVSGDAETVVREIAQLLHDIEWSASGDYARDRWRQTLAEFCSSWRGGYEDSPKRKLTPKFDLEHGDRIVDMGGRTWALSRRLYDIDTDERLYEFVRLGDEGRQTVVLEQSEVHDYHEVLFDEGDETA